MELPISKVNLRQEALKRRNELSALQINHLSCEIIKQFTRRFCLKKQNVSCFLTMKHKQEVETETLISVLESQNQIFVPVSNFEDHSLLHVRYNSGDELILNPFRIPEPNNRNDCLNPEAFDVVFVPCLVVDHSGNRLGYGKGFYDRFLSLCGPQVIKVGLNFFEPIEEIPSEPNDIKLDYLVTPHHLHEFK